ncbi:MAG: response regulator [Treponema sp.]|nr:response regulator [Treponema sp.]
MKAVLICEDNEKLNKIFPLLQTKGYDLIVYKWFLKAMDNLEEIKPDLVILSAKDFPRHWKTLVGFLQGVDSNTKIYLFEAEEIENSEKEKINAFNCVEICSNDFSSLPELQNKNSEECKVDNEPTLYPAIITEKSSGKFYFTDVFINNDSDICCNEKINFDGNDFIISYMDKEENCFSQNVSLVNNSEKALFHEKE